MSSNLKVSKKDFWEDKYTSGYMPWDIGQAAPAFVKYFSAKRSDLGPANIQKNEILGSQVSSLNVAVLGCGRGHDAFYIAKKLSYCLSPPCSQVEVYGFDFADKAINFCNEIKVKEGLKNIYFYQVDFFELTKDKKWENYFDYVIEHTSLAAIDPNRRKEYVDLIKYLLKSSRSLVGLFFVRPEELGGPPFGITLKEIRELFKDGFIEIEELHLEECLHKNKLEGDEYFSVFEKRSL